MRVFKVICILIVFLLVAGLRLSCRAASLAGGLAGIIQDSHGTPLDGIAVILLEGQFSFKGR